MIWKSTGHTNYRGITWSKKVFKSKWSWL